MPRNSPMPGRRLLICRYLRLLRRTSDQWRKQANLKPFNHESRMASYLGSNQMANAMAEGFTEGLWIIGQYLPLLIPADVSAWLVQYRINEMVGMMPGRFTDPEIIPFATGVEATATLMEAVARKLSGPKPGQPKPMIAIEL